MPLLTEMSPEDLWREGGESAKAEIRRRLERLEKCEAALRKIPELIDQYTRSQFYMWLVSDQAGIESDPTKRAREAIDAARAAVEGK